MTGEMLETKHAKIEMTDLTDELFKRDFPDAPYQVFKKIGQGTFSSVYLALHLNHSNVNNTD